MNKILKIIIGFDFGMKRIGVAIGQTVTQQARPLKTIAAKNGLPKENLDKLIQQWKPDAFVVGIPLNMDGTEQSITHYAKQFAETLRQQYHLPVFEVDERLTTKAAREKLYETGGFKALQDGQVDSMAAQLILENWLIENSTH